MNQGGAWRRHKKRRYERNEKRRREDGEECACRCSLVSFDFLRFPQPRAPTAPSAFPRLSASPRLASSPHLRDRSEFNSARDSRCPGAPGDMESQVERNRRSLHPRPTTKQRAFYVLHGRETPEIIRCFGLLRRDESGRDRGSRESRGEQSWKWLGTMDNEVSGGWKRSSRSHGEIASRNRHEGSLRYSRQQLLPPSYEPRKLPSGVNRSGSPSRFL